MGYTPLYSEILTSTIWAEPDATRLVWVTMLALKNYNDEVMASVPGLAHVARVSVEACEAALKKLYKPDPYSRSTEFDGRRIEQVDGGWRVLNGPKYRAKMAGMSRKSYKAMKQREYRSHTSLVHECPQMSTMSTCGHIRGQNKDKDKDKDKQKNKIFSSPAVMDSQVSDISTPKQPSDTSIPKQPSEDLDSPPSSAPPPSPYGADFLEFWKGYPRKIGKGAAWKAWRRAKLDGSLPLLLRAVELQKTSEQWVRDNGQFIPHPQTWINQRRWEDEVSEVPPTPELKPTTYTFGGT